MGTLLDITLHHETEEEGKRLLRRCFQEARRLEEVFSTHDDGSDLSRLNRHAGLGPFETSGELWSALEICLRLGRGTEEALDITIGPLMDLWRAAEERSALPSPASVAEALSRRGISKVHLLPDGRGELRQAGMRLDLGGIGKGFAVDRLRELLIQEGIERAFINFGRSSLAAVGSPPERKAWPVLLQGDDGEPLSVVHLRDQALSVSGSFGQSYKIGETRYGHLIDPRDGFPVRLPSLGVAVARTATEAEALTKALVVFGPEQGFAVLSRFSTAEGLLTLSNGSRITTPRFTEAVRFETEGATSRKDIS
ncbi:MAG: FAD:protein FMN transferase [candidate division NC10 bacterium]|nr:FAD:protein FMN transferase [candidate division NC10 bacterium]